MSGGGRGGGSGLPQAAEAPAVPGAVGGRLFEGLVPQAEPDLGLRCRGREAGVGAVKAACSGERRARCSGCLNIKRGIPAKLRQKHLLRVRRGKRETKGS